MRALIVASMAASLLFSSGTPSSAEGVDMPTTSTQPQGPPQPEPHPPRGK